MTKRRTPPPPQQTRRTKQPTKTACQYLVRVGGTKLSEEGVALRGCSVTSPWRSDVPCFPACVRPPNQRQERRSEHGKKYNKQQQSAPTCPDVYIKISLHNSSCSSRPYLSLPSNILPHHHYYTSFCLLFVPQDSGYCAYC